MKNKRNMFYSNNQSGAFIDPQMQYNQGMMPQMTQPQGYMQNSNYQAFGPNAVMQQPYGYVEDEIETRITKLERQIRNIDTRLQKLETGTQIEDINTNTYMI